MRDVLGPPDLAQMPEPAIRAGVHELAQAIRAARGRIWSAHHSAAVKRSLMPRSRSGGRRRCLTCRRLAVRTARRCPASSSPPSRIGAWRSGTGSCARSTGRSRLRPVGRGRSCSSRGQGIGRTALLEHAVRAGRALGLNALAVAATALEADHAFGVARLIFESHIDRDRALAPTWGSVRRSGRVDEQAVFDELLDRTLGLARRRPVMIAVDDAQWADPQSVRWLAYLCRRVEGAGVLVAVADRTSEIPREKRALAALRRAAGANVLRPRALSRIGVGAVVRARLGWTPGADALEACHEMTRGDPRLLRELLAAIGPQSTAGVLSARSVLAAAPPSTRRAIAERLSRLTPAARALAGAAAVLGDRAELRHARVLARLGPAPAAAAARARPSRRPGPRAPVVVCGADARTSHSGWPRRSRAGAARAARRARDPVWRRGP